MSLYVDCQYSALKEEMIRNRIVVGIRDPKDYKWMLN